ncbi:glycosyltransferase family 4 protein [Sphingobacterium multivorum]|uniref:glycosyltransferase family 4 protein n=1 Tax=Sphingobacterium multivorum TaxID=28454 RepID=UPI0028ACFC20|nr:glycosyltransferase family 4 protein [Sphingobacterium multivorum]
MKILFICNEYPPFPFGGLGVFVRAIGPALEKTFRVKVYVLCMRNDIECRMDVHDGDIEIIQYPLKRSKINRINMFYKAFQQNQIIKKIVHEKAIDIVEISSSEDFYFFKFNYGAKLVVRTHGSLMYAIHNESRKYIGRLQKMFKLRHETQIYRNADRIVTISKKFNDWFSDKYGEKVTFIPNFLQSNFVEIGDEKEIIEQPYIFHHGTLKEDKGTFDLVKAFVKSTLHKSHYLILAGKISDKDVERLDSIRTEKIITVGVLDNCQLKAYLRGADFSIYPSRRDAFNLCVIESMSQECLTLTSDIIDEDIIKDGSTGIRKSLQNDLDILSIIEEVAKLSYSEKESLKLNGRIAILKKYSPEVIINKNYILYTKLMENSIQKVIG